jgi:antagonist of KipI
MCEAQTTGGYPRIAKVTKTDLRLVAQARPGHYLRFEETSLEAARASLIKQTAKLHKLKAALHVL